MGGLPRLDNTEFLCVWERRCVRQAPLHHHVKFRYQDIQRRGFRTYYWVKGTRGNLRLERILFRTEELEIPDLENNENVAPDAVEAMYADFGKRSVGLAGTDFVEAFPEGVRTDPQNRLCISYSSVVTMLVEAVKEQQKEIEELRKALEENGLMKKQR